jgi:hypothetical protein
MLHFWFGFLRGAWAGPVFPQGIVGSDVVWRQFASWKIGESTPANTWLPEVTPLDLTGLFSGFTRRWTDASWHFGPVGFLVRGGEFSEGLARIRDRVGPGSVGPTCWVHLVETQRLHSRGDFRRISAAGRIRALLHHVGVSTMVPDYFTLLPSLQQGDAFDGPGIITMVRNALVHPTEENLIKTQALGGEHLLECGQLGLHYVELSILAICGHSTNYARRGWKGWKGEDEVAVPWAG